MRYSHGLPGDQQPPPIASSPAHSSHVSQDPFPLARAIDVLLESEGKPERQTTDTEDGSAAKTQAKIYDARWKAPNQAVQAAKGATAYAMAGALDSDTERPKAREEDGLPFNASSVELWVQRRDQLRRSQAANVARHYQRRKADFIRLHGSTERPSTA